MASSDLDAAGLECDDTTAASDHLPLVADLIFHPLNLPSCLCLR
jgi:hypothetical protein